MTKPYPIVYIRGFAMFSSEVEDTFNSPYNGFNDGSTQLRQVSDGKTRMHIFESPVIRLIKEAGYQDSFGTLTDQEGSPLPNAFVNLPLNSWRKTLWIHRLYDPESNVRGHAKRPTMIEYALGLARFLTSIQDAVVKAFPDEKDFKVNLVAHSMGGLVARTYLQSLDAGLCSSATVAVDKLFTYATPHGGITFRSGLDSALGFIRDIGLFGTDVFTPNDICTYLNIGGNDPRIYVPRPPEAGVGVKQPPVERVFCLVGTDAADYTVAYSGSRRAVGPTSDGLVQIENAWVAEAPRAYVRKSHSGHFGIVNSAEGYFHLSRFLLGDIKYRVTLEPLIIHRTNPNPIAPDNDNEDNTGLASINIDLTVTVRSTDLYVNVQRSEDFSAIPVTTIPEGENFTSKPVLLAEGFLDSTKTSPIDQGGDNYVRFAVNISLKPTWTKKGLLWGQNQFRGDALLSDRFYVGYRPQSTGQPLDLEYQWESESGATKVQLDQNGTFCIPFPKSASPTLVGQGIRIAVTEWV